MGYLQLGNDYFAVLGDIGYFLFLYKGYKHIPPWGGESWALSLKFPILTIVYSYRIL
jgi:hypothetical protein